MATLGNVDVPEAVVIHQLSTAKSQTPFSKKKGLIRSIAFAVTVPHIFIATQRHIRQAILSFCITVLVLTECTILLNVDW